VSSFFFFLLFFGNLGQTQMANISSSKLEILVSQFSQRAPDKKSHSNKFNTIEYLAKHHVKCACVRLRCACKTMVHEEAINCEIVWKENIEIIFCFLQSNLMKCNENSF
jgi:hypothetical protein